MFYFVHDSFVVFIKSFVSFTHASLPFCLPDSCIILLCLPPSIGWKVVELERERIIKCSEYCGILKECHSCY